MGKGDYKINLYAGADYGFDSKYGKEFSVNSGYKINAGSFGITTDPRSANQLQAVSNKLNTGAKIVEITGIQMGLVDMIPKQHYKELERLKKLVGAQLTFHGPLVEPSGATQQGYDPIQRKNAENQMWSALERAQGIDPKGNIVVTFHSSNGLPMPETWTKEKNKEGKDELKMSNMFVVNPEDGRLGMLPKTAPEAFDSDKKELSEKERLKELNKDNWTTELSNINLAVDRARTVFSRIGEERKQLEKLDIEGLYKIQDTEEGQRMLKSLDPESQRIARNIIGNINFSEVQVEDSLRAFKKIFNEAAEYSKRVKDEKEKEEIVRKLNDVKEKVAPIVKDYVKDSKDPKKIEQITEAITDGLALMKDVTPQKYIPLREFAIEQAAESFSEVAKKSYEKFKNNSPIISIENPPVGMGLSRAKDLRELIEASRKRFVEKMTEKGMSEGEAERQAEKIIGATWDVGHINMVRGFGFNEKDVVKESEIIAPMVKHVHLSDNFGLEHTELPMGMGNVPTKEIMELSKKFRDAKKIVETSGWFGPQGFGNKTPLTETFRAFNSPIYGMEMGPSWQGGANNYGSYFSGFGRYLPEQHFSIYGAGFSNLPPELGGQMAGRSRASGAPVD